MSDQESNIIKEPFLLYDKKWTYADYLQFDLDYMVELIQGRVYKMTPAPSSWHQEISMELSLILGNFFSDNPCKVFHAPFDVILPINNENKQTSTTVVQPDLCVICDLVKIEKTGCFGPPDLLVEILSPSTSKKDLNQKYEIYEITGVKEYWIVYPMERIVTVYVLQEGKYSHHQSYTHEDEICSALFPELKFALSNVLVERK